MTDLLRQPLPEIRRVQDERLRAMLALCARGHPYYMERWHAASVTPGTLRGVADLARLPYLAGVIEGVQIAGGFPMLDRSFQTSAQGLYFTGFAATREFGPFFGFLRGATAAATIITRALSEPATAANDGRDRRRAAA